MSFAQVQDEIRSMPRAKRRQLLTLLNTLEREESAEWQSEIERRKAEMKRGNKLSRAEAMKLLGISEIDVANAL